jgi:YHS domain-containing protein
MLLHSDDVEAQMTWRGISFKFCSDMCKRAFAEDPSRFVSESGA